MCLDNPVLKALTRICEEIVTSKSEIKVYIPHFYSRLICDHEYVRGKFSKI
jgi:hypothetical protein